MPTTNLGIPYLSGNLQHPEDAINDILDFIDATVGSALDALQSPPSCHAFNNANIAVTNNSEQALALNSEHDDNNGIHSTSVNTSRLTCQKDGPYVFHYSLFFASNATGYRYCYLRLNGATALNFDTRNPLTGQVTALSGAASRRLVVGDYVEIIVFQNSGGSLNVVASGDNSPEFSMEMI